MPMKAGFGEVDITPPVGTHKIGWLKDIVSDRVLDPLFARVAVFECDGKRAAFIALDTLSIRWTTTMDIRNRIENRYGFPGSNIMVAATHNHAGPAVANVGDVKRDEAYVEKMVQEIVSCFGAAIENARDAEVGMGSCFEFRLSRNRRVVMRDGTVQTHGRFDNPLALCFEGPIDPEVAVLAARDLSGKLLGAIVNFACHPTHHGGGTELSAGYPGVLAAEMKKRQCPVTLFLNGACGNIHDADPTLAVRLDKESLGRTLAEDAAHIIASLKWRREAKLGVRAKTIQLPFRKVTDAEVRGTVKGAQRKSSRIVCVTSRAAPGSAEVRA
jgi:neutral ceramidase